MSVDPAFATTTIKLDFGRHDGGTNGDATLSPDVNGNYWNNLSPGTATSSSVIPVNTTFGPFVTTTGAATSVGIKITSGTGNSIGYWECNGKLNGGLTTPSSALLGDFAIPTVTEDYWFLNLTGTTPNQTAVTLDITGLDPAKEYSFRLFGTRDTSGTRTTRYTMTGLNSGTATLVTSGVGIGSAAHPNGNDNTIVSINDIVPTAAGTVQTKLEIVNGGFAYLGAMEIAETPEPATLGAAGVVAVIMLGRKRRPA
jgi:hypothetical protein